LLLQLKSVRKQFGELVATNNVNLTIKKGELRGLIGPNGAGKTTLFNLISGFLIPDHGTIEWQGEDITKLPPNIRTRKGIVRTFQLNSVYKEMSVIENVGVARHIHIGRNTCERYLRPLNLEQEYMVKAKEILDILELEDKKDFKASVLAHGELRRLGIAMALATEPQLLLLDEPFTGMISSEVETMLRVIKKITKNGTTIMIVEHNVKSVFKLCKFITVLDLGTVIKEGTPEEVIRDKCVIDAYLGTGSETYN